MKRKGRDASEQLQPFHTPATKSATTTVDMMRKDDDGEEDGEKDDDDDDNNNNNNNVWLHGRGKPVSVPASSYGLPVVPPISECARPPVKK